MVTPEMEVKFAGKGVSLVTPEAGRGVFKQELTRHSGDEIEIICGAGPWEEREARIGAIRKKTRAVDTGLLMQADGNTSADTVPAPVVELSRAGDNVNAPAQPSA
jgi:hypothetical protein